MEYLPAALHDTMAMPVGTAFTRLAMAGAFGAVIGLDREARDHAAGLRTHILVSLAACLFTLIALELFERFSMDGGRTDPIRVIEAVTAGVAFLAAGSIIHARGNVRGLTTGAGMWLAGAVGLSVGAGLYLVAIAATVMAVIVLVIIKRLEP
ncbi:MAG: MgtC/SapB family protein [Brucellaceae bacterium]|uniref:MgtC/SapB family protein n=1 Tax=Zhengella sp. TaxID=2282762 RepID=UPI001D51D476|nr:MgtC/SapB family protein [Notoacmeibacter sp.]MCC0028465.1 MgtC/SapB family protein [Brucellaceae bacterium]